MVCLGAVSRSDIALDRDGLLDDPDYISNLPEHDRVRASGRNVFAFSLSVAAHMTLQLVNLLGAGDRIGGIGPQVYHAYPGTMEVAATSLCDSDCEYAQTLSGAIEPGDILPDLCASSSEQSSERQRGLGERITTAIFSTIKRTLRKPFG
jgi:hypothetical protein